MTEGRETARRKPRAPLGQRSRRRWAVAGGVAVCWVVLEVVTGSAVSATVLLVAIAGLGAAAVAGLRAMGITRDHPWIRRIASRPWRDGQDVLRVALRHLPDVFVITPSGSLLAPNVVELQLNPDDLISLTERMELGVVSSSVTEVYEEQVAAHGARLARPGRADVYVVADDSLPPGRYRLRQGLPVSAGARPDLAEPWPDDGASDLAYAAAWPVHAESGGRAWQGSGPDPAPAYGTSPDPSPASGLSPVSDPSPTVVDGRVTITERTLSAVPVLRLVTGSSVAETVMSGARAGRGTVELVLPDVPTVSREHARFTFGDGRWWVTNRGTNGLTLNGVPVAGEQPLSDGDEIRWGKRPDALLSRVEIG